MQHLTKAATIEVTDEGVFEAIAAAYTVDRDGDRIVRGAFAKTIRRWRASGKRIPLHWSHLGEPENIIGSIDPATMRETGPGLHVEGRLDLDESAVAREVWRSMKNNAISLSFGFLTTDSAKAADGVNELREIDLFEVSLTPAPANADTRIVSMKSIGSSDGYPDPDELRRRLFEPPEIAQMRSETAAHFYKILTADLEPKRKSTGPIRVANFEC